MFSSQVFESALSITMFVLRILVPLLSTVVLVRCFVSLKRGRRKEARCFIRGFGQRPFHSRFILGKLDWTKQKLRHRFT